jgi:hypothetical protein
MVAVETQLIAADLPDSLVGVRRASKQRCGMGNAAHNWRRALAARRRVQLRPSRRTARSPGFSFWRENP